MMLPESIAEIGLMIEGHLQGQMSGSMSCKLHCGSAVTTNAITTNQNGGQLRVVGTINPVFGEFTSKTVTFKVRPR